MGIDLCITHRYNFIIMETLRKFLNSLSREQQIAYAKRCNTSIGYLRKAITMHPKMDGALCLRLEKESHGQVKKQDLRPDIWPELVK